jgi:hypothetical protein
VNWYAHAVLAERACRDPGCLLGAMLPDLAAAAGLRLAAPQDGRLARGVRLHQLADAAFHAAPEFVALVRAGRSGLEEAGLPRGSARGAAHVGIELLLDGWVASARRRSSVFDEAVRLAFELAGDRGLFRPEPRPARWRRLCARLAEGELPEGYADPERVALGVERALAARPRLALPSGARPALAAWLRAAQPELAARAPALLERASAALP